MIKKLISGTLIGLMIILSVSYVNANGTGEIVSFPDDAKNELSNVNLFNTTTPISTTSIQHNFGNLTDTTKYDGFVGYGSNKYNLYTTTSRGVVMSDSIEAKVVDNFIEVYSKENYNFIKGEKTPKTFSLKFKVNPATTNAGRGQSSAIGIKNMTTDKYIISAGLGIWQQWGYSYAQSLGENWCNANPSWNTDDRKCLNSGFTTGKYIHIDFLKNNGKNSTFFYKIPDLTGDHTFDVKFDFETKILTIKILNSQNIEVMNNNISVGNLYDFDYSDFSNFKYFARSATTNNVNEKMSPISTSLEFTSPPPPSTNIPGLVADYTLNGNAKDTSGNGSHGTASNVTYETLPNGNKVAVFNGSSSKIETSSTVPNNNNVSFNTWIYDSSNSGLRIISADSGGGYFIIQNNAYGDGKISLNIYSGGDKNIKELIAHNKNEWINYIGIITGGALYLYKNGELQGTQSTGNIGNIANGIDFGTNANTSYWNGKMSQTKIFNRALTETEISQLYNEGIQYLGLSTPPTAPTSFITSDIKNNQVTYTWTDTSAGTAQETKFILKNESNEIIADNIATDATTFTETGLSANTSYQRKICAVNSAGKVCSELITLKTLLDSAPSEKTTLFDFYGLSISVIETTKFFKVSFTIGKFKMNFSIENTEIL